MSERRISKKLIMSKSKTNVRRRSGQSDQSPSQAAPVTVDE